MSDIVLPAGWRRRHITNGNGAFTVATYANKVHLGHYRFTGFGPDQGWRFGDDRFDTEADAFAALLEELTA